MLKEIDLLLDLPNTEGDSWNIGTIAHMVINYLTINVHWGRRIWLILFCNEKIFFLHYLLWATTRWIYCTTFICWRLKIMCMFCQYLHFISWYKLHRPFHPSTILCYCAISISYILYFNFIRPPFGTVVFLYCKSHLASLLEMTQDSTHKTK